ncbi:MAG TPA: hypothetical protein VGB00_18015 [Pyrinomonadaceae bacterium]|jgi:hypothetical protein
MIKKIFAFTLAMLFVLNTAAFADTKKPKARKKASSQSNRLVALLPASDGVMFLDVQRLLNEALPQVFSSDPAKLNEINQQIDQLKAQTGFDVRQFEQIAVGITFVTTATSKNTIEPVVLARGKYNSSALLTMAKIAAKGKYREEKIGNKAVYIFAAKEILTENKSKITNNSPNKAFDFLLKKMPSEIAVTPVDANTLAIGSIARVRETVENKARIGADIASMLNRKPNSLMSFAANTPAGLKQFFQLDDDMFGQSLASIRQIYGAVNLSGGNVVGFVGAKSLNAEQAKSLEETLGGLQALGKGFLASARSEEKQVYARIVDSVKITRAGLEVGIDFQVANTDLGLLIK